MINRNRHFEIIKIVLTLKILFVNFLFVEYNFKIVDKFLNFLSVLCSKYFIIILVHELY